VNLLSLDPGTHATGWALFQPAALTGPYEYDLTRCGLIRGKTLIELAADTARQIRLPQDDTRVVMERPQVYVRRKNKTKGDPNALITLAIAGGVVLGVAMEHNDITEVELTKPAEWKMGQTPKEIENVRAVNALTGLERACYRAAVENIPASLHHNVLDAVAVGLWAVGRKQRRAS